LYPRSIRGTQSMWMREPGRPRRHRPGSAGRPVRTRA
jgi:hypothetical protein